MKNSKMTALAFAVIAAVQLAVPVYMAWHWEDILQTGSRTKWVTAPVDPYDAFKGRYVDLSFKENLGPVLGQERLEYGQTAYALLEENAEGRSFISGVTGNKPADKAYIKVQIQYVQGGTAHVKLPFKRYYLPEGMAPAAETAYRESAGKTGIATVRIKDGLAVVEQLYIGEKTLEEHLRSTSP